VGYGEFASSSPLGRHDPVGEVVCLTVYKKGAMEMVRRLAA